MIICILHTANMAPVPNTLKVVEDYGSESVVSGVGRVLATGDVLVLDGTPEAIKDYLRPYGDVWTSSCPAAGAWEIVRVKE